MLPKAPPNRAQIWCFFEGFGDFTVCLLIFPCLKCGFLVGLLTFHSSFFIGSLWGCLGTILVLFWVPLGVSLGLFGGPWGYFGSLCRTLVDNFGCVWGAEGPLAHFAAPWLTNLGAFGAQRVISLFQGQGGIPKVGKPSLKAL